MKIILTKTIEKLGKEGQIVEVKDGYARNFLFPKKFALPFNKDNLRRIEEEKRRRIKEEEKEKSKLLELKQKIEKISLTIQVEVKKEEEIYGSISEAQILKALKEEEIELKSGKIILDEPIKKLGVYNLRVKLHPEIDANLRVWVVKK